jgi:hypothetical protein
MAGEMEDGIWMVLLGVLGPLCMAVALFGSVGYLFGGSTICELYAARGMRLVPNDQ